MKKGIISTLHSSKFQRRPCACHDTSGLCEYCHSSWGFPYLLTYSKLSFRVQTLSRLTKYKLRQCNSLRPIIVLSRTLSIRMNRRLLYTFVENRTLYLKHQVDCQFFPCVAKKTRAWQASALCPTSSSFGPKSGKLQMSSATLSSITPVTNKVKALFSFAS